MDQSRVEFERGAEVPRAAVAPTADGLSNGTRDEHEVEGLRCVQRQAKGARGGLDNRLRERMTGSLSLLKYSFSLLSTCQLNLQNTLTAFMKRYRITQSLV
jgi:hypothetical protein